MSLDQLTETPFAPASLQQGRLGRPTLAAAGGLPSASSLPRRHQRSRRCVARLPRKVAAGPSSSLRGDPDPRGGGPYWFGAAVRALDGVRGDSARRPRPLGWWGVGAWWRQFGGPRPRQIWRPAAPSFPLLPLCA